MTTLTVAHSSTVVYTLDRYVDGSMCNVGERRGCRADLSTACIDALELRQQDSGLWDISMTIRVYHDSAGRSSLAVFVSVLVTSLSARPG